MITKVHSLSVGQAGTVKIDIPVYTIGEGSPIFGITCSVHGDEPSGLFVVSRLLALLQNFEKINGTLHIIPSANPAAQLVNTRVSPFDLKDLNRAGSGRAGGTFTDRVGARLFEFLSQCDLVVNIHEFEMHTPVTAVFMNAGNEETKVSTLSAIKAFSPDIIWVINTAQSSDVQYQSTLDTALAQSGIANFPIETAQLNLLSDQEIDKATMGLYQVAAYLGMCEPISEARSTLISPAFFRQEITAENAGLWEPKCKLMQTIDNGSSIGNFLSLPDFKLAQIQSPADGVLVQYRHRQLVSTGTSLFSIGHKADNILLPYLG